MEIGEVGAQVKHQAKAIMGSTFENFYSSKTGNQYNDLELPGINKLSNGNI